VTPCITLAYAEERIFNGERVRIPCQVFGDVHRQNLGEIWDSTEYNVFRQTFERRRSWQQQNLLNLVLDGEDGEQGAMPAAPLGCQTCYYLYGI